MNPSGKNREERRFSDVRIRREGRASRVFLWLRGRGRVVYLKPAVSRRHPILVALVVLAASSFLFLGIQRLFTRAEVADFFPATCLGTWANVQNAQGKPESLDPNPSSTFSGANSAVLDGAEGQIFCGGFLPPEYPATGNIKNVGLTFVWRVGEETSSSFPVISPVPMEGAASGTVLDILSTSTQPSVSSTHSTRLEQVSSTHSTSSGQASSPPASSPQVDSTGEQPATSTSGADNEPVSVPTTTTSFFDVLKGGMFSVAFADDSESAGPSLAADLVLTGTISGDINVTESGMEDESTSNPVDSTEEGGASEENGNSPASEDEIIILGPPISATLTPVATSSDVLSPEFIEGPLQTDSASSPQAGFGQTHSTSSGDNGLDSGDGLAGTPDEHFLKISYSTDGQTWVEIAKVHSDNWQNLTVTLPIKNWSDLARIQIAVETMKTTQNPVPPVYLDGMFLEVHYDVPPVFAGGGGTLSTSTQTSPSAVPTPATPTVIVDVSPDQKPLPVEPGKDTFRSDEAPQFDFDLNALPAPATGTSTQPTTDDEQPTTPSSTTLLPERAQRVEGKSNGEQGFFRHALGFFLSFFKLGSPWFDFAHYRWFDFAHHKANAQGATPPAGDIPTAQNPIVAKVLDPENRPSAIEPIIVVSNNKLRVSVPEPKTNFRPGRYKLQLWILQNGTIYYTENDFTWGVLVVNFNKAIYTTGNETRAGFGVLDDRGRTICDAEIEMSVIAPTGETRRFSTRDGAISKNDTCGPQTVTNNPDYSASLLATNIGHYSVIVSAETKNGTRRISDGFDVADEPAFDVERSAPTRIYPPAMYKVTLSVRANRDFKGKITETVPHSFYVAPEKFAEKTFDGSAQSMHWSVDMKKGEKVELAYFFDAPDISPELYKLGPLQIGTWTESRQWQIASDDMTVRANSVEFFAGAFSGNGTTGQNSDTNQTFSQFDFRLAESNVSIKNAYLVFESQFEGYVNNAGAYTGYNLAFDACSAPCTPDAFAGSVATDTTVLAYDETESNIVRLLADVTQEAQLAAYAGGGTLSGQVGYNIKRGTAVNSIAWAHAKLAVTYTYNATSTEHTNTVIYPLDATSTDLGTLQATQSTCTKNTNCPLFNYNVEIPEVGGASQRLSQWFTMGHMSGANGATDSNFTVNVQGTDTDSSAFIVEAALGGGYSAFWDGWFSGVAGYGENTTSALETWVQGATANFMLGGETFETYIASSSAATKTRTVRYPVGVVTDDIATANQDYTATANVYFPEAGVAVKSAWWRIIYAGHEDTAAPTLRASAQVGSNATTTQMAYASDAGTTSVGETKKAIYIIPDSEYATIAGASATTSVPVAVNVQASANTIDGVSAELMVTYTYTGEDAGYMKTISLYGGQTATNGNDQSETFTNVATSTLPEATGTSTIRAAGILGSYLFSDSDGAQAGVEALMDMGLATSGPSCVNAFRTDTDAVNGYSEFYRNVSSTMTTADDQAYSTCYTNDGGGDADNSDGAKMNGIIIYTYQWDAPPTSNSTPVVSAVSLNHGNPIILSPNATASIDINYTVTDDNGCADVTNTTSTAFRGSVSSTCAVPNPTTNNLNCYLFLTHTTSSCASNAFNATDTVGIYYFAQSTGDASSSFPSDRWYAYASAIDAANATGSATSSNVNVNVLLALNITAPSISYGTVLASSTTGATNQTTTIQNVGNASQTLKIYGTALNFGSNSIATSSQHYATSSFTFGGFEQVLNELAQSVSGFLLAAPTSTSAVQRDIFWGIGVPSGNVTGTYSGTNIFTAFWSP